MVLIAIAMRLLTARRIGAIRVLIASRVAMDGTSAISAIRGVAPTTSSIRIRSRIMPAELLHIATIRVVVVLRVAAKNANKRGCQSSDTPFLPFHR